MTPEDLFEIDEPIEPEEARENADAQQNQSKQPEEADSQDINQEPGAENHSKQDEASKQADAKSNEDIAASTEDLLQDTNDTNDDKPELQPVKPASSTVPFGAVDVAQDMAINMKDVAERAYVFATERANIVAKNAASSKGIRAAARNPEAVAKNTSVFDIEVKQGSRTDQERSGRCWMFASLNVMRQGVIERLKLKDFELSQAYPLFWDKLEKSNWFLENIIDTIEEPLDGREVAFLLTDPVGDGGQWDMFAALVKKYGVVPKEAMPETANSKNTHDLDAYLTRYLRQCALRLRDAHELGVDYPTLRMRKQDMLTNIQNMLTIALGTPPTKFEARLRDKDDKLVLSGTFTPQQFFNDVVKTPIDDYVSLICAPTADKPFDASYTVSRLGNVIEAGGVRYLNLPIEDLKACAIAQLKDGEPVWFGCDVDQSFLREDGMMDLRAVEVDALFGFAVSGNFAKDERLDYGESCMTHAMVLEGVNLDNNNKPTLWKVENSWGKDHGKDGFDTMTDGWFSEYVYQVVINKKYLTQKQLDALEQEPIVLKPWDPMGALAKSI